MKTVRIEKSIIPLTALKQAKRNKAEWEIVTGFMYFAAAVRDKYCKMDSERLKTV